MKISRLLTPALLMIAFGCSKDKYQTKPQISIKSYDPDKIIPVNGQMTIKFNYTDKEGDLADGQFVYYPKRVNQIPYSIPYVDSVVTPLDSDIPDKESGEIELRLDWLNLQQSYDETDTVMLYFVLVDRAGNRSDSIASDRFAVLHP